MKTKKSISFFISLSVIFCILYIILAIKPLGKEYQFTPEWKIDVASPNVKPIENDSQLVYFKLGQTMGYFTEDGDVVNFITFPLKHLFLITFTHLTQQIINQQNFILQMQSN